MTTAVPLTAGQMQASLEATLAAGSPAARREGVWVFAYGSLIWKPEFDFDRRVPARVWGYHRKLCLRSMVYRGTPECPGLVAGLDRGGSCAGIAYRLPRAGLTVQLERLWQREMFMGSYLPRWFDALRLDGGGRVPALAFVMRRTAPHYCGGLSEAELIDILHRARGRYGTSMEYLQRTVAALRAEGLRDPHLERLLRQAEAAAASV
jgi:cation transport protein ChaC